MSRGGAGPPLAVCAPNAFKGTIAASAAADALARGVADAGWTARRAPTADGGDGTLDVLLAAAGKSARVQEVRVTGPLGRPRLARLGWIGPDLAVVEMAEAAGLRLLGARRDPLRASSRGAGELITAALDGGARRIVIGVGGSASTDGGAGILAALGARLLDARGRAAGEGGGALAAIASVDLASVDRRLGGVALEVAVDVRSPLFGPHGAARVFAPQKGADAGAVAHLDAGLRHLAALVESATGVPGLAGLPGAGAAGGAGFALAALGARLVGGAGLVCDQVGLDAAMAGTALVITGEGRLDHQTATGKAPAEVAARALRARIPCVAVCGSVDGGENLFSATIALDRLGDDPARHVRRLLRVAAAQAVALIK
ncbi:MAG TPA: glycerate kinase [Candidatus Dormibacteraeota bacterium]|nr:glycerate kinase [Candidatus Dormibacteraeota bacterium]